jgi:hypothetical protein
MTQEMGYLKKAGNISVDGTKTREREPAQRGELDFAPLGRHH